jgi:hypothetical protein
MQEVREEDETPNHEIGLRKSNKDQEIAVREFVVQQL